ncbi:2221_t:CDS:1, partial [Racocetra fulgida]
LEDNVDEDLGCEGLMVDRTEELTVNKAKELMVGKAEKLTVGRAEKSTLDKTEKLTMKKLMKGRAEELQAIFETDKLLLYKLITKLIGN